MTGDEATKRAHAILVDRLSASEIRDPKTDKMRPRIVKLQARIATELIQAFAEGQAGAKPKTVCDACGYPSVNGICTRTLYYNAD